MTIHLKTLLIFSFIIYAAQSMAGTTPLARITRSDGHPGSRLVLVTNQRDDIKKLKIYENGRLAYTVHPGQLRGRGKVIYRQQGQNIVVLRSQNFSKYRGGNITLNFLREYNIIGSNDRRNRYIELVRTQDGWKLLKNGHPFRRIHIRVWKWGIKRMSFH